MGEVKKGSCQELKIRLGTDKKDKTMYIGKFQAFHYGGNLAK